MPRKKKTDQEAPEQTTTTIPEQEAPEQTQDPATEQEAPEQPTDTAPEQEAPEQPTDTAPEQEAPEQSTDTDTETVELTETEEQDIFANIPNPCVYCGPTVRGVARQYTTYQGGGIPDALRDFIGEHPEARQLIVSTAQFPAMRKRLDTPGTAEAKLYKRVKAQL